jgi:hypothetical protein
MDNRRQLAVNNTNFQFKRYLTVVKHFFFDDCQQSKRITREAGEHKFDEFDCTFEFTSDEQRYRMITRYGGFCDLHFVSTIFPTVSE